LLPHLSNMVYPDLTQIRPPDLTDAQSRLTGWGVPSVKWVSDVSKHMAAKICGVGAVAAEEGCLLGPGHKGSHGRRPI